MKIFNKLTIIIIVWILFLVLLVVGADYTYRVIDTERNKVPIESEAKVAWEIKFDGEVVSTPILDGNILYVQTTRSVSAIDLSTRGIIWKANITGTFANAPFLLNDGILYINDKDFEISAINASSGDVLWHNELNAGLNRKTVDIVFHDNRIYIAKYLGRIYSLDGVTGETKWIAFGTDRSTLWLYGKENDIFVVGDEKIFTFEASDGSLLFENISGVYPNAVFFEWEDKYLFGERGNKDPDAIRIFNDEVNRIELVDYLPISGVNCAIAFGDELIVAGDGIVRYDSKNRSVVWDNKVGTNLTCPLIFKDRIYVRKNANDLYIYSLDSGELIGGMDIYSDIYFVHDFSIYPFMVGDLVVVQTDKNVLSAVRFSD